jgi:hypothetical protein
MGTDTANNNSSNSSPTKTTPTIAIVQPIRLGSSSSSSAVGSASGSASKDLNKSSPEIINKSASASKLQPSSSEAAIAAAAIERANQSFAASQPSGKKQLDSSSSNPKFGSGLTSNSNSGGRKEGRLFASSLKKDNPKSQSAISISASSSARRSFDDWKIGEDWKNAKPMSREHRYGNEVGSPDAGKGGKAGLTFEIV